ncbi:MAG: hypothetical protein M3451_07975, partial [Chloroflexota bacterium]|nr:hypothetical protein [Chloroflexota bacterium]
LRTIRVGALMRMTKSSSSDRAITRLEAAYRRARRLLVTDLDRLQPPEDAHGGDLLGTNSSARGEPMVNLHTADGDGPSLRRAVFLDSSGFPGSG